MTHVRQSERVDAWVKFTSDTDVECVVLSGKHLSPALAWVAESENARHPADWPRREHGAPMLAFAEGR